MTIFSRKLVSIAAMAAASAFSANTAVAEDAYAGVDLARDKVGSIEDFQDISAFCGTEPLRVALSDGFGENSWRKITRAEFEDEAAKCPNITEVRYTNGQGNPQKQIADIQGLIAQQFDVIVLYPDGGEAILNVMNQATRAGISVVPHAVGETFPGVAGEDYATVATDGLVAVGRTLAEWTVKNLDGEGNVIILGGTPGNNTTAAIEEGWTEVFAKHPGIKVLEGPVDTNWDPAESQRVMASLLAKYPDIDAVMSDYGQGSMGALRAFVAAGRPIPLWPSQDANELGCFWQEHHADNPDFELATVSARTWMSRLGLRKAVAAAQGIDNLEPSVVELPLVEDSASDDPALEPKCNPDLPPDAILSSMIPQDKLMKLLAD